MSFQSCLPTDVFEYDINKTNPLDPQYDGENFWYINGIIPYIGVNQVNLNISVDINWDMFPKLSAGKDVKYCIQTIKMDIVDANGNVVKQSQAYVWESRYSSNSVKFTFSNAEYQNFDISQHYFRIQAIYAIPNDWGNPIEIIEGKVYDVYP